MDEKAKKKILKQIPYGLFVITARSEQENDSNAFSASWLSQASFKPPLLMFASQKESKSTRLILESGFSCINLVDKNQQDMIKYFFKPSHLVGDKLGKYDTFLGKMSKCPVLKDALAYLEVEIKHHFEYGDHTVFVAEIINAEVQREGTSLVISDTPWSYAG